MARKKEEWEKCFGHQFPDGGREPCAKGAPKPQAEGAPAPTSARGI